MMSIVNREALRQLRVQEGKRQSIGSSSDPLDGTWTRPSEAFKRLLFLQQAGALIIFGVLLAFLCLLLLFLSPSLWLIILLMLSPVMMFMLALGLLSKWIVNRIYERHRFRITDEELIIETGLITTNRVLIPLIGVQQVSVIETFWSRRYGLKTVVVNTAGFSYVPNAGIMWGSATLMGLKNADEVAEDLLSRVKEAKARANAGV